MRFTRRLPDWRVTTALSVAVLAGSASCSINDEGGVGPEADASNAFDGNTSSSDSSDGSDASAKPVEPQRSDAGPLAIECGAAPCATSIVTTVSVHPWDPSLYAGDGFCVLVSDGTVACWGQNEGQQLGRPEESMTRVSATAKRVEGLTNIVSLGHSCAIDREGTARCWGMGPYLRDDDQPTTTETTPVQLPISKVTSFDFDIGWELATACAISDGKVVCWGTNRDGLVDVPVPGASTTTPLPPKTIELPPGAPPRSVFVGNASFVLREDGTLLSWGASPPLGRTSSLFPDPYPKPLALEGVTSISVAGDNACATAQGIAYCWGTSQSYANELGRALPEPLPMPEPVVQIATAATYAPTAKKMPHRGCACGVSGALYCWGNNDLGQVGDGTTTFAFAPVKIGGLPAPVARVKTTARTTCAVLKTGKVFCWGDNYYGQLGRLPIKEPSLVPAEVVLP